MNNCIYNKKVLSAFFLLFIFVLLFPVVEFLFLEGGLNKDLLSFIFSQTASLIVGFYISLKLNLCRFNPRVSCLASNEAERFVSKVTFFLTIVFFVLFLSFYLEHVSNVTSALVFAEEYRNGFYKGSGVYTVGMIQFLPVVVAVMVARFRELDVFFYLTFFLLVLVSFLLGLRVILLIVYFFLLVRLLSSKRFIKSFLSVVLLILVFVSYKIFLAQNLSDKSIFDIFLHIAGRMRYRFLVHDSGFLYSISEVYGFLPYFFQENFSSLVDWKTFFSSSVPNIFYNMPFISLFSGLAWPYPLVVYNSYGFLGFIFVFPIVVCFVLFFKKVYNTSSVFFTVFSVYFTYFFFSILIEDIYQFTKMPLMIILTASVYFYFYILINLKIRF